MNERDDDVQIGQSGHSPMRPAIESPTIGASGERAEVTARGGRGEETATVTGIVLAGGRSRRFGSRDKLTATVDERPLIHHVAGGLSPAVDDLVVSCRTEQITVLEDALEDIPSPITFRPDLVPDRGPLGGIASALEATASRDVLVVAGDLPLVTDDVVETLLATHDAACTVPVTRDGRRQPLCAAYRRSALRAAVEGALEAGERSMRAVLDRLHVDPVRMAQTEDDPSAFVNVNTPADLRRVAARVAGDRR
jgi:molybdenum cofactor guanylyltransferase